MRDIDGLVIGGLREFDFYREDLEEQDGVVFARSPGGWRAGSGSDPGRGDADRNAGSHGASIETLRDALKKYRPRRVLMLTPYRGMSADAARLMAGGVELRTAGPMPVGHRSPGPSIVETHRSEPGFPAMLEAGRHADFGDPVYFRQIASPDGGKWQKWWYAFQSCRKAEALLDSPLRRVYVAAAGTAPRLHVSITLKTHRNSTGHLLVAPNGSRLEDDMFLVGTGGTLADDPLLNQPGMYGKSDYRMLTSPLRRRLTDLWRDDAAVNLSAAERRFYLNLLRAIGDSSRRSGGVCLEYPAA